MMIEIENLVKRYKEVLALNHFNLTVEEGTILGLLGPNGSGKSTAIHCMLSLLTYDRGTVKLFGEKMSPTRFDIKRRIGIVPQDIAVFEELTVVENIDYYCGLYVNDKKTRKQYVEEVIELVGLEKFRKFHPNQLSGGLKRRLNIACGISHKPELIFLDEPTVAVDPQSRNKILNSIKELNQQGATIVYTTHYMEEIEILCDKIVIIDQGQVIAEGTKEELKNMIRTGEKLLLEVPELSAEHQKQLQTIPGVQGIDYNHLILTLHLDNTKDTLLAILNYLMQENIVYANLHTQEVTLNDVFLEITGKELRD
ncbi:ABC transporter ATP-binding protein [Enterococcus saccharolyticus]|uniref:ABC transporter ATP-binding protein n=1 Tax=Candidatus Enterococcus willemsii TaxID=1857215 RepID=A0ABQ6YWT7_9ENTE|nr:MULTISPECIES: ABC transporter ATP-binding protein [Enterococcus]KAF1302154.1 ABC transporter ATP-binding protein [Enterococcus sp. CU12B]MCD5001865.1 ABC transporter ATP-binding protein [Enterococcus saccharolyticus]